MQKAIKVITPSATPLLPLGEVKRYLKVVNTSDHDVISDLILSAIASVETYLNKHILNTSVQQLQDDFEYIKTSGYKQYLNPYIQTVSQSAEMADRVINLMRNPASITSVYAIDEDNVKTEITEYTFDSLGRRLIIKSDYVLANFRNLSGLEINYICGYGSDASDAPVVLKVAIKNYIYAMYKAISRNDTDSSENPFGIPEGIKQIINSEKIINGL
jgi:hypothetical protein